MDAYKRSIELLTGAMELLEPSTHYHNFGRDTIDCGACGRYVYVAYPVHQGQCNQFCEGTHVQHQIDHHPSCIYVAIKQFLDGLSRGAT